MVNLTPAELTQLSNKLKQDIDEYCVKAFDSGPRSHLGASEIGNSCSKALWLKFRWTAHKIHSGQQQRLFQRGHFEEPRFVSYLEGIGCTVKMFDKVLLYHPESDCYFYGNISEDNADGHVEEVEGIPFHEAKAKELGVYLDKGKRQIRISACKGHFGGSIDGLCTLPEHYQLPDVLFLDEFKTQGVGKKGDKFDKLVAEGVKKNKPVHWAQKCIYGYKLDIKYGIYMSVNKNDDNLHIEVVELDHYLGAALERKAEMIIFSQEAPQGIGCNPSYYECSWCDFKGVCFGTEKPLVNCRSCCNAFPTEDATWTCKHYGIIPKEHISTSKPCWESIL